MFKKVVRQQNVQSVSEGGRGTVEMGSLGSTIHNLFFTCFDASGVPLTRAEMELDIDKVELRVGGDLKWDSSAKFCFDHFAYYNDANDVGNPDGQLVVPLANQDRLTELMRALFAYGTSDVDSFFINFTFKTHGAFKLSYIEFRTQQTDERRALGQHRKIQRYTQNYDGSGGLDTVVTLPNRIAEMSYKALHIEEGGSTIDDVTLKIATTEMFKDVYPELNDVINGMRGRTNQSGYFHLDFSLEGETTDGIPMAAVADFRQEIRFAGTAGQYDIMSEEIWGLKAKVKA